MIDISGVKVGDRVRVSRANGDEATVTVFAVLPPFFSSDTNNFLMSNWDSIEVLDPSLPTAPGFYLDAEGDVWQIRAGGQGPAVMVLLESTQTFCSRPEVFAPYTRLIPEVQS